MSSLHIVDNVSIMTARLNINWIGDRIGKTVKKDFFHSYVKIYFQPSDIYLKNAILRFEYYGFKRFIRLFGHMVGVSGRSNASIIFEVQIEKIYGTFDRQ